MSLIIWWWSYHITCVVVVGWYPMMWCDNFISLKNKYFFKYEYLIPTCLAALSFLMLHSYCGFINSIFYLYRYLFLLKLRVVFHFIFFIWPKSMMIFLIFFCQMFTSQYHSGRLFRSGGHCFLFSFNYLNLTFFSVKKFKFFVVDWIQLCYLLNTCIVMLKNNMLKW